MPFTVSLVLISCRRQAAAIAQIKRHSSWMLCEFTFLTMLSKYRRPGTFLVVICAVRCSAGNRTSTVSYLLTHRTSGSLVICSCACGETFPFLIQSLYHGPETWVPILISTLCLALLSEILPQFVIPRSAITWGYYCCPIIWGCMILTGPISFPIAWILDTLLGKKPQCAIFTNEELEELIKYHDRSERRGGQLGEDAARVAMGALKLESRTIGSEIMRAIPPVPENCEMDIEKAPIIVTHGLIVKWSSIKTINIDDLVDDAFLNKVKDWSYSRIPVISKAEIAPWVDDEKNLQQQIEDWDGTRIYGVLHTRVSLSLYCSTFATNNLGSSSILSFPLSPFQMPGCLTR
jgi:hypothetical protein